MVEIKNTKAAILVETGKPLILAELAIPELKYGQVLVEIHYSGVCHTQILEARGHRGEDKFLPHCFGHEGSGVVIKVGSGVTNVKPGDKVVLSWMQSSGIDVPGTRYKWGDKDVNAGAITTFSEYSVISENRLTVIKHEKISLEDAALLGCAAATGLGSVFNVAKPVQNSSLAVFGAGGIGLCAIMAAKISGCVPLIAVDINDEKLKLAKELGATHTINATKKNPVEEIKKICGSSLDYAIESSGIPSVMIQAIESIRNRGGTAVIIGNAPHGQMLNLDPHHFNMGKKLLGTWGGDNVPDRDFPKYMDLIAGGKFNLKSLMSKAYTLSETNKALDDLENGKVTRPLIKMR